MYKVAEILRQSYYHGNKTVVIDGVTFKMTGVGRNLRTGDTYVAGRNTGPHLLTVDKLCDGGWISSKEDAYPYDLQECYKVEMM